MPWRRCRSMKYLGPGRTAPLLMDPCRRGSEGKWRGWLTAELKGGSKLTSLTRKTASVGGVLRRLSFNAARGKHLSSRMP
jgi:hypothetical protein